jgi:hypothetical protein
MRARPATGDRAAAGAACLTGEPGNTIVWGPAHHLAAAPTSMSRWARSECLAAAGDGSPTASRASARQMRLPSPDIAGDDRMMHDIIISQSAGYTLSRGHRSATGSCRSQARCGVAISNGCWAERYPRRVQRKPALCEAGRCRQETQVAQPRLLARLAGQRPFAHDGLVGPTIDSRCTFPGAPTTSLIACFAIRSVLLGVRAPLA